MISQGEQISLATAMASNPLNFDSLKAAFTGENKNMEGRVIIVSHNLPYEAIYTGDYSMPLPVARDHLHRRNNSFHLKSSCNSLQSSTANSSRESFDEVVDGCRESLWKFSQRNDHSAMVSGILSLKSLYRRVLLTQKCFHLNSLLGTFACSFCIDLEDCVFIGCVLQCHDLHDHNIDPNLMPPEMKQELIEAFWEQKRCIPLFVEAKISMGHYEGYCKNGTNR